MADAPATSAIRVAMLLAAGRGERLRPLTDALPKPLLPLLGRPIIGYLLDQLSAAGIKHVVINLHHLGELLRRYVADGSAWGLDVSYSPEARILGTAGGLKHAAPQLGDETFLVLNADVVLKPQLARWLSAHRAHTALATLVVRRDPQAERYGSIGLHAGGRLGRFLETRAATLAPGDDTGEALMFTGAALMEPALLQHIPAQRYCDISREIYPELLRRGLPLAGVRYDEYWQDLGTAQRYLQVHWDVLDGQATGIRSAASAMSLAALAAKGVQVEPPVWLAKGCRVEAGAALGPYAVLGARCSVAVGASLVRSVAWHEVRIESRASIRDSILANGVRIAARSRVEGGIVVAESRPRP